MQALRAFELRAIRLMAEGYLSEEQLRSLGDLECHTWGEVEVPETFRDLEITIGTPPVDFLQYQEGGGNI